MKQVPNIFTLLNLLSGCLAIVFILQNGIIIYASPDGSQLLDIPEPMFYASLCIGISAVIDFLDGFVARLFKASSEMGKQLDSLADVVSFGVAPGMILYQFLRLAIAQEPNGIETSIRWLIPAFIVPMAGAWRLARFNIDPVSRSGFQGVPIPAAGLMLASLPLIYWNTDTALVRDLLINKWFIIALALLISFLMVSRLPMLSFKFKSLGLKDNLPRYLLILIGILAAVFLHWLAVPLVFMAYVLISLLFKNQNA